MRIASVIFLLLAGQAFAGWSDPVVISETDVGSMNMPRVAEIDGELHVVYYNYTTSPTKSRYVRSLDFGEDWDPPIVLEDSLVSAALPNIAISGQYLHTAWKSGLVEGRPVIYYKRSMDRGNTWEEGQIIHYNRFHTSVSYAALAVNGDTVFCAYKVMYDIWLTRSFDNGETWEEGRMIVEHPGALAFPMTLLFSEGRLHLVHQGGGGLAIEIFHRYSDDGGDTWSDPVMLSTYDEWDGQWPSAYADTCGNIAAAWFDYKYGGGPFGGTGDILLRYSTDNGQTWEEEVRLTESQCGQSSGIFIEGCSIYAVYDDIREGNPEIYMRTSHDLGGHWSDEERLTYSEGVSFSPRIIVNYRDGAKHKHLIWREKYPQSIAIAIYYMREISSTGIAASQGPESPLPVCSIGIYPNPFNDITTISCYLPRIGGRDLELQIYDIGGKLVRRLSRIGQHLGYKSLVWDGRSGGSQQVGSGIYLCVLSCQGKIFKSAKIAFIK
ncbi:MAG: exo-alpha-sialidase [Candidatus Zixiibacteriota bacterium]